MNWVVFSASLPSKASSSPRVTLWRRLRRLGAVSPAGGVYILPAREECVEAFQWLVQEIRQAQGEALVMHVAQFEGLTDQEMIALFQTARTQEYEALEKEIVALERTAGEHLEGEEREKLQEALAKLRRRHAEIARVDYFDAPAGARIAARLAQVQRTLSPGRASNIKVARAALDEVRNAHWVTRPRPHVDRLACAWLIRRFVNPDAAIRYGAEPVAGEVAFDIEGAQFGHQGNLCTFETMLQAFGLDDPALAAMAEIIHEIDLCDGQYARPETAGIDAILQGWQLAEMSDAEREMHGIALFEGLYKALAVHSSEPSPPDENPYGGAT